ncbi:DUF4974 domain-containing protein [Prolixibacteraceae bacterium JC049]|nr:DUF4974 domain-containing protein [Prolixibacteraceae bacterium JC049]
MTKNIYTKKSVEQLLEDDAFIALVRGGKIDWEEFLLQNKDNKSSLLEAKRIISALQFSEDRLGHKRKIDLWQKLEIVQLKSSKRYLRIRILQSVAACMLFLLSLGGGFYWYNESMTADYEFAANESPVQKGKTLLVLSTGEAIQLKHEQATIKVENEGKEICIVNDTTLKNLEPAKIIKKEIKLTEVVVPFGKNLSLTLSDGTKVWLNAGSRFAFPQKFEGKYRKVHLDGEGYFEVAKMKHHPFILTSNHANIEVLGTKFNVSTYDADDYSETVLLEGSVKVMGRNKLLNEKVIIEPGQSATYNTTEKKMAVVEIEEPEKNIAWINGWYEYKDVSLDKVLKKLERYYNVKFIYDENKIKKALPISGKLDLKSSIENVMPILSGVTGVNYIITSNYILIKH